LVDVEPGFTTKTVSIIPGLASYLYLSDISNPLPDKYDAIDYFIIIKHILKETEETVVISKF